MVLPLQILWCKAICSDCQILRETNKYAFFTSFDDLDDLKKTTNEAIQSKIKRTITYLRVEINILQF